MALLLLAAFGGACLVPSCGRKPKARSAESKPQQLTPTSAPLAAGPTPEAPDAAAAATPSDAAVEALSDDSLPGFEVSVALAPGRPECTMLWEASTTKDNGDWFVATGITRIETLESASCAAHVVFDLETERGSDAGFLDDALEGGVFPKPGRPPSEETREGWCKFEDLNFDGFADLCAVQMTGAYNYSQRCFVFHPKQRIFNHDKDLDELIFMDVDTKRQRLKSSYREGGPYYASNEYGWVGGKLVPFKTESTVLGETPNGKPLPPGYGSYVIRHERRGGRLVKVFEGPVRDK